MKPENQESLKKLEYRKDIDGLRGIAVLSVILFHAGVPLFDGGFIGVDIFFVISGYLITSIILIEKENGTFSLWNFYERRARRILPALFVVMATCVPFAWKWMLPNPLKDFGQSLIATSFFASNILFWRETGYFALAAEEKPLLHTWSLAVEEQFYILFPLLVLLLWRYKRQWLFPLVLVGICLSFGLSEWGWRYKPQAAFYLMPTRAWEIGIGCLVAFLHIYHQNKITKRFSSWFSAFGLMLLISAIFIFNEHTPNPSYWALLPLIGTALILLFPVPSSLTSKILTFRPLTAIGLISYSAYLWHQPIFAFIRIRTLNIPTPLMFLLGVLGTLLLGWFSWKYVEQPFRNKNFLSKALVLAFLTTGMVSFITIGGVQHKYEGFPHRIIDIMPLDGYFHLQNELTENIESVCVPTFPNNSCVYGNLENLNIALLGDSHAGRLKSSLWEAIKDQNLSFQDLSKGGCLPLTHLYSWYKKGHCSAHNNITFDYLRGHPSINTLILSGRWATYLECQDFNNTEGGREATAQLCHDTIQKNQRDLNDALNSTTRVQSVANTYTKKIQEWLYLGKRIVLVYPVPEVGWHVPQYIMQSALYGENVDVVSTDYQVFLERNHRAYKALDAVGKHPNLRRVYPEKILCNTFLENRCVAYWNEIAFYSDDDHLSIYGAELVVEKIMEALEDLEARNAP